MRIIREVHSARWSDFLVVSVALNGKRTHLCVADLLERTPTGCLQRSHQRCSLSAPRRFSAGATFHNISLNCTIVAQTCSHLKKDVVASFHDRCPQMHAGTPAICKLHSHSFTLCQMHLKRMRLCGASGPLLPCAYAPLCYAHYTHVTTSVLHRTSVPTCRANNNYYTPALSGLSSHSSRIADVV